MALRSHRPAKTLAIAALPWAHSPASCEASFAETASSHGGLCLASLLGILTR